MTDHWYWYGCFTLKPYSLLL